MTREEFGKFFKYVSAATNEINASPERRQVYYDALNDIPLELAMMAARKIIATLENPFLPMPAVFRKAAQEIVNPQTTLTAAEAWAEAVRAVRRHGWQREAEGLASLSPTTQKVMKSIGWKSFCSDENEGVLRGQFRMAFETIQARDNQTARLPEKLKEMIAQAGQKTIGE